MEQDLGFSSPSGSLRSAVTFVSPPREAWLQRPQSRSVPVVAGAPRTRSPAACVGATSVGCTSSPSRQKRETSMPSRMCGQGGQASPSSERREARVRQRRTASEKARRDAAKRASTIEASGLSAAERAASLGDVLGFADQAAAELEMGMKDVPKRRILPGEMLIDEEDDEDGVGWQSDFGEAEETEWDWETAEEGGGGVTIDAESYVLAKEVNDILMGMDEADVVASECKLPARLAWVFEVAESDNEDLCAQEV